MYVSLFVSSTSSTVLQGIEISKICHAKSQIQRITSTSKRILLYHCVSASLQKIRRRKDQLIRYCYFFDNGKKNRTTRIMILHNTTILDDSQIIPVMSRSMIFGYLLSTKAFCREPRAVPRGGLPARRAGLRRGVRLFECLPVPHVGTRVSIQTCFPLHRYSDS